MVLVSADKGDHWTRIFQDLWDQTSTFQPEGRPISQTGANVQLCCSDGRAVFHVGPLLKFTNLLDFAFGESKFDQFQDPFGNVTILVPDFNLESVNALGRLIYCGDTGTLDKDVMNEIIPLIRSEYGNLSLVIKDSKSKCDVQKVRREESEENQGISARKESTSIDNDCTVGEKDLIEEVFNIITEPDVSNIRDQAEVTSVENQEGNKSFEHQLGK